MADDAKYKLPAEQEANLKAAGIENAERSSVVWNKVLNERWEQIQQDEAYNFPAPDRKTYIGAVYSSKINDSVLAGEAQMNQGLLKRHQALHQLYLANMKVANQQKKNEQDQSTNNQSEQRVLSPNEQRVEDLEAEAEESRKQHAEHQQEFTGKKRFFGKLDIINRIQSSVVLSIAVALLFGQKDWKKYNPGAADALKNCLKDLEQAKKTLEDSKQAKFGADLSPIENQENNNNADILPLADAQTLYEATQDNLRDTVNEVMSAMPPEQLRELLEQIMDNPQTAVSIGDDDSAQANPLTISNNPSIPAR